MSYENIILKVEKLGIWSLFRNFLQPFISDTLLVFRVKCCTRNLLETRKIIAKLIKTFPFLSLIICNFRHQSKKHSSNKLARIIIACLHLKNNLFFPSSWKISWFSFRASILMEATYTKISETCPWLVNKQSFATELTQPF